MPSSALTKELAVHGERGRRQDDGDPLQRGVELPASRPRPVRVPARRAGAVTEPSEGMSGRAPPGPLVAAKADRSPRARECAGNVRGPSSHARRLIERSRVIRRCQPGSQSRPKRTVTVTRWWIEGCGETTVRRRQAGGGGSRRGMAGGLRPCRPPAYDQANNHPHRTPGRRTSAWAATPLAPGAAMTKRFTGRR
jgi:hypothetical protein